MLITSRQNTMVKKACALFDRRDRDTTSLFLIEGYRELERAVDAAVRFEEFFFCPELFLGENESFLLEKAKKQGAQCIQVSESVLQKLSYRDRPDGLVAVAQKMNLSLCDVEEKLSHKKDLLVVIAEAIEKPGNLGTILRSSDAAGVDLVIIANRCTDIYNPNVVRASVGTLFTIPVIETSNEEAFSFCQNHTIRLLAATPEASALYTETPMVESTALVVGTEQLGLSSFWKGVCDTGIRIPMAGVADSLNVATATTLVLYEAVRQRHSL